MATRKTYKPKAPVYVPQAIDGDNDGLVQEGTEFERPVETELEETVAGKTWTTHLLADGENILTVAKRYTPQGMTWQAYAKVLARLNGSVSAGQVVRLG